MEIKLDMLQIIVESSKMLVLTLRLCSYLVHSSWKFNDLNKRHLFLIKIFEKYNTMLHPFTWTSAGESPTSVTSCYGWLLYSVIGSSGWRGWSQLASGGRWKKPNATWTLRTRPVLLFWLLKTGQCRKSDTASSNVSVTCWLLKLKISCQ